MVSEALLQYNESEVYSSVLILVLVEDGLGGHYIDWVWEYYGGLNPCFSGGWSRR